MINVREGCFETNSSSTHNMVVVEDSQLEKWKNGDLFYVESSNDFVGKYARDNKVKEIYGSLVMEYANDQDFAEEIANAMVYMAENPEERRRMARVGYRRLMRKYKIEDMKKTYEGIYRKAAERQNIDFE